MPIYKHIYLILFSYLIFVAGLNAQKKARPSEKDVLLEQEFIKATKERILGNHEKAIELFQQMLSKDQDNPVIYYELARIYQDQDDLEKASLNAEKAVLQEPKNLMYAQFYSNLLEQTGNARKAVNLYEMLIDQYPDWEELYHQHAYFLIKAGDADKAIKVYNNLEKRKGIQEMSSMRKYQLYLSLDKDRKALKELKALIDAYPDNAEYIVRLANYYATHEDQEEAQRLYKKAIELDPQNTTANMALVNVFAQDGDTTKYINALQQVFEDENQPTETKIKLLTPLLDRFVKGELDAHFEALKKLTQTLADQAADNFKVQSYAGHLALSKQQYAKAENYYQQAIELDKSQLNVWVGLLETQYRQMRYKTLSESSKEVVELFPSQAIGLYYRGLSLYQLNDYEKASKMLDEAIEIAVIDPSLQGKAYLILSLVQAAQNKTSEAQKSLERAKETLGESSSYQQAHAVLLSYDKKQANQAAQKLKKLMNEHPQTPNYQADYAWALYQQADYQTAAQTFEKVLESEGVQAPKVLERYGDTLFQLGQTEEAVKYWQKALDMGNASPQLPKKISTKKLYE